MALSDKHHAIPGTRLSLYAEDQKNREQYIDLPVLSHVSESHLSHECAYSETETVDRLIDSNSNQYPLQRHRLAFGMFSEELSSCFQEASFAETRGERFIL
jgi:hypothetical protein